MNRYLLTALILLLGSEVFAQSVITLPASFQAEFRQTITNDKKKRIEYRGDILFSSPNSFKWHYTSPTKKEVCTDGKKLLVVDHDLEQVSSYLMDKGLDLSAILKSAKPHRKSVYIANYQERYYTIQVNRKQELSRIAYRDNLDNNVLIVFSKMKYSRKKIPDTRLQCHYPKNYDWIGE